MSSPIPSSWIRGKGGVSNREVEGFMEDLKAWERTEESIRWENRASNNRVVVRVVWGESRMSLDSLRRLRRG